MTINGAGPAPLEISVEKVGTITVLSVRGEVDLQTSPHLTESIDVVMTESAPTALIIDLTDVPFLASVGMTVLFEARRRAGDTTRFAVIADGPTTKRPLVLMGLDQSLVIYSNLDAALTALGS